MTGTLIKRPEENRSTKEMICLGVLITDIRFMCLMTPEIGMILGTRRQRRSSPLQFGESVGTDDETNLFTERIAAFLKFVLASRKFFRVTVCRGLYLLASHLF